MSQNTPPPWEPEGSRGGGSRPSPTLQQKRRPDPGHIVLVSIAVASAVLIAGLLIWFLVIQPGPTSEPSDPQASPSVPGGHESPGDQPGGEGATTLTPDGPASAWLDPGYAYGVESWDTELTVVGVSADRSTVLLEGGYDSDFSLMGADTRTGEEKWTSDLWIECGSNSMHDGHAYCVQVLEDNDLDLIRVDVETGSTESIFTADFDIFGFGVVGSHEDVLIGEVRYSEGVLLLALPMDGSLRWVEEVFIPGAECAVVVGHVACNSLYRLTVLDASDGSTIQEDSRIGDQGTLHWALDGYTVEPYGVSMTPQEIPIYDFIGEQLGTLTNPRPPSFPSGDQNVFYPIAEFDRSYQGAGVDVEGNIVVTSSFIDVTFVDSDAKARGDVIGISSDGNAVLMDDASTVSLHDRSGELIEELGIPAFSAQIMGGLFMWKNFDEGVTTIYYPADQ